MGSDGICQYIGEENEVVRRMLCKCKSVCMLKLFTFVCFDAGVAKQDAICTLAMYVVLAKGSFLKE
jgi:hypothetical protein